MGGIFILAALFVALAATPAKVLDIGPVCTLLIGFATIGFVDDYVMPRRSDKRGLGWIPKLTMQIAVGAVYSWQYSFTPESFWAAFWVLFFANAVNFSDGLDALAGSILIIALVPFCLVRPDLALPTIGAILPFLILNAPPAKVFMGDVGALPLGALFGHLFAGSPWQHSAWPWALAVLLILELVMVPMQIASVKLLRRRIFPATPIHHGFEKMGWQESKIVWTFVVSQAVLSAAALSTMQFAAGGTT
jgi:phospho-N-acetylmuramoyl-pentapeptide-transferase